MCKPECIPMEENLRSKQILLGSMNNEDLECIGYRESTFRRVLFSLLTVLLLGIPYILLLWKQYWKVRIFCYQSPLKYATHIILKDSNDERFVEVVIEQEVDALNFPCEYTVDSTDNILPTASTYLYSQIGPVMRFFHHKNIRYAWNETTQGFFQLLGLNDGTYCVSTVLNMNEGLSAAAQRERRLLFGVNSIVVEVKSYPALLFEEVLNPFYIFQTFSIILWCVDEYYFYAVCIFLVSSISIIISVRDLKQQSISLRNTVTSKSTRIIKVLRKCGVFEEIDTSDLVPGDIIEVPPAKSTMPCDAILLGGVCIINEAMLTGESVPVTKTALPYLDEAYNAQSHKRHTLFSGTEIIQTRYFEENKVLAVVSCTGFSTSKGELVRAIMHPKPMDFHFYRDSMYFISLMFGIAALGMAFSVYLYIQRHADGGDIALRVLDIVTIVVPPALPAAMTIGIMYAQSRLKKHGLYCIAPSRINVAGKAKLICFDKTGTLTEDGLDMRCVVPVENKLFGSPVYNQRELDEKNKLLQCMATCHSLTQIDGEICGDPLDLKMFQFTKWILEEPKEFSTLTPIVVHPSRPTEPTYYNDNNVQEELPYEIGIVHQFPFSSTLQRMSVVSRTLGENHFKVFVKGSPEAVKSLCLPDTIPHDFGSVLQQYTLEGYRVLALAYRSFPKKLAWHQICRMHRDKAETELTFLGLLVMQNSLKPESAPVISQLQNANLRCVMLTGDNLLTAVSVGRECGMIQDYEQIVAASGIIPSGYLIGERITNESDEMRLPYVEYEWIGSPHQEHVQYLECNYHTVHIAMTGKTWSILLQHFPNLVPKFLLQTSVFARMSPDQKAQVIQELQKLGYVVAMCGDGANDCSALKSAHVGVSLSEAEASVAAPFTSHVNNITCIPALVSEGRCALVTSFGAFKYMSLYSIIQFASVILMYLEGSMLGDIQNLYLDLILVTVAAFLMGRYGPQIHLSQRRPNGRLIAVSVLLSLAAQMFLVAFFQSLSLALLKLQPWYVAVDPGTSEGIVLCWENTVLFFISSFQYLTLAVVFSDGAPFRQPFYTDLFVMSVFVVLAIVNAVLFIYPGQFLAYYFEVEILLTPQKQSFLITLFLLTALHFVAAMSFEKLVVPSSWMKHIYHFISRKRMPRNLYKLIQKQLADAKKTWPLPGQKDYAFSINDSNDNDII